MPSALLQNALCRQLNLKWPLIQAPMGGLTTPELVATVSNTGALGSLGAAYLAPELLEQTIKSIQQRTKNSFGVNLFAPTPTPKLSRSQITAALKVTQDYRNELALAAPHVQAPFDEHFDEQFAVVLKYKPAVFSYTFGLLTKELIKECHQHKIITMGTATTLEEGMILQEYGVDAIIAQGAEAGGHRGYLYRRTTRFTNKHFCFNAYSNARSAHPCNCIGRHYGWRRHCRGVDARSTSSATRHRLPIMC